jgi:hypothetical protein
MANQQKRRVTSKPSKTHPATPVPKPVVKKIAKKPKKNQKTWGTSMLALAILSSSIGLLALFAWISILLIFNPEKVGWLNIFLPEWARVSLGGKERPKTFKQIKDILSQQGKIAGDILPLSGDTTKSFLLPIFQERANCQSDCKYLVELRVYDPPEDLEFQSKPETHYSLTTQIPVEGPEESFVVAPLLNATTETPGSNIAMPLNTIQRFEGETPSPGIWFYLQGKRSSATGVVTYGHILHYNTERSHLQLMLPWTSTTEQLPQWQQITGSATKELIVNQTVGLEPQLRVYQIQPAKFVPNPIQLAEISLQPPALKNSAYEDAILFARTGLWTPALERLESIKKQRQVKITSAAQAQIDVIRLHSQLTKTQAEKIWASPSQEVLADLIDGRWQKALQVFEASPQNSQEIRTLLKSDGGRLWSRAEATLQIQPNQKEAQAWSALILAASQSPERANSWLKTQTKIPKDSLTYIQGLLDQLQGKVAKPEIYSSHSSHIVGAAKSITQFNPTDWLQSDSTIQLLQKTDNQWYEIEVTAFYNGKVWLSFPFTNLKPPQTSPGKFFWDILGIKSEPTIQIVVWQSNGEQQTTLGTIKGVKFQNGALRLLAHSEAVSAQTSSTPNNQPSNQPRPLALSNSALEWAQPSPMNIEELFQQNPQVVKTMLPTLWRSLQQSGQLQAGNIPNLQELLQKLGHWPVQVIDLTGNGKPEKIITISTEAISSLIKNKGSASEQTKKFPRPRTLILSDTGSVIYTDFKSEQGQSMTAIAKLYQDQPLTLLVETASGYSIRRWSNKNQRFE